MRNITIIRKKSHAASLIPYRVMFSVTKKELESELRKGSGELLVTNGVEILNGRTEMVSVSEDPFVLFVYAPMSSGNLFSDEIKVGAGKEDLVFEIVTEYKLLKGPKVTINELR